MFFFFFGALFSYSISLLVRYCRITECRTTEENLLFFLW